VTRGVAELVRPPRRIRPSDAAGQYLRNDKGPWTADVAPMMLEPLDLLGGREYTGIVLVGPQRGGKTFGLIHAGVTYAVTCAPGDAMIVQMSQDVARDFSRMEVDRVIRYSPELAEQLSPRARDDNTYDKFFRSGMVLKLAWPSINQLSGKTLKYVFIPDYDRPENRDNVDGEGSVWDLAFKRIQTYMSRGKCLAESSPGEPLIDPRWMPKTAHEAPPVRGILELYNRGTRARWYWPCIHCAAYWEPKPGLAPFALPELKELEQLVQREDLMTLANRFARVVCPHCGVASDMSHKREMNLRGRWVHEGETLNPDGSLSGRRRDTPFASFWFGGAAASHQRWDSLLYGYFQALLTYVRTGDEQPMQFTTSSDQAAPYIPRAAGKRRTPEELVSRLETWERGLIPAGVRFLTAAVDVQAHRFVVQVMGWGVGLESWVIERFSITASNRPEGDRYAGVDPAAYVEDWNVLVTQVIERKYRGDGGFELPPVFTLCDSGGREGVTDKAYDFWRVMRAKAYGSRFMLLKGVGNLNSPRTQQTWPDAKARKDRTAGRGDVPVWLLNVNVLKDGIHGDLAREVPGPGYVHLPNWLDADYFNEITAETRTAKGWERPNSHVPNEAFDLHAYNRAAAIILKAEAIDWNKPPEWAMPFDKRAELAKGRSQAAETRRADPRPKRNWVKQW
jgi:phage terminase large subunit GpA-like protein